MHAITSNLFLRKLVISNIAKILTYSQCFLCHLELWLTKAKGVEDAENIEDTFSEDFFISNTFTIDFFRKYFCIRCLNWWQGIGYKLMIMNRCNMNKIRLY